MQLEGFLSRFPLRELLELSVASLVNGALEVYAPAGVHRLYMAQGECVHATAPGATGFEAIWPLFELNDAPFKFVSGLAASERTITEPTLQLIEQAATLAQRWATIRSYIPSLEIVPQLVARTGAEHVRIFEEDWPTLSCVDGARTVREIAEIAIADTFGVCKSLIRLKGQGLVTLSEQRPVLQPAPISTIKPRLHAKSAAAPEQPASFFAKLLTTLPEEALATALPPAEPAPNAAPGSATQPTELPSNPVEYDDILSLLRAG